MSETLAHERVYDSAYLGKLAQITYDEAGLIIEPNKMAMVQSRLRHRLVALNLNSFEDYCDYVSEATGVEERRHLISALTTNVSGFFREQHHFDIMLKQVFPTLVKRLKMGQRARIWSAGCSNGQEPLSVAMLALETDPIFATGDFKILASDIDPGVLAHCRRGAYTKSQVASLEADRQEKYFTPLDDENYQVSPDLTDLISFKELNLMRNWPMSGLFDVILCRNVVIYFDAETQAKLWPRFHAQLADDGWMFVGHSERIADAKANKFKSVGPTAYRKTGPEGSSSHSIKEV